MKKSVVKIKAILHSKRKCSITRYQNRSRVSSQGPEGSRTSAKPTNNMQDDQSLKSLPDDVRSPKGTLKPKSKVNFHYYLIKNKIALIAKNI